jgi:DNA-binding XRE family transcriptional regulator
MKHPLTAYREETGVKSVVLAGELDISRQSLFRIEKGQQTPSVDLIKRIVSVTGGKISANDLLGMPT